MKNRFTRARMLLLSVAAGAVGLSLLLSAHNVSREITAEDRTYIAKILGDAGYDLPGAAEARSFDEQLAVIRAVQDAVMRSTPGNDLIPLGSPREPRDLYYSGHAQCSDRSRVIDKTLRLLGFDTRYAFVLGTEKTGSPALSLISSDVRSHAVVEVKTARGWMIVDSVKRWVSLTKDGLPVSLQEWQNVSDKSGQEWHPSNRDPAYWLLNKDFTFLYGLYSRHGKFYPPYTPFPDVNWGEFLQNLRTAEFVAAEPPRAAARM